MPRQFPRRPPRIVSIRNFPVWLVTFCTHRREPWLAQESVHIAFTTFARRAFDDFNIAVGRYVIMPDHIHLFVCGDHDFVLTRWIAALKQALAKSAKHSRGDGQIWQEGFFDHLLRDDESMSAKWDYMRENPVRAALVTRSEDWPHQGEIIAIDRA